MTELKPTSRLCRRAFFKRALAAAALALPGQGRAQSYKMTKKQAGYKLKGKNSSQTCVQCIYFIDPNDCVLVQGPVSPNGWCTYYGD